MKIDSLFGSAEISDEPTWQSDHIVEVNDMVCPLQDCLEHDVICPYCHPCEYYAPDCGGRVVCRAGLKQPDCECGRVKDENSQD
jgi:hypothetical protein